VFNMSVEDLKQGDIPVLSDSPKENFAMLDIAYYTHEHHVSEGKEESVAAHYDPGVLSINVFSSQKGLQFRTQSGAWVDIPTDKNVGVIWAGELATTISNGKVKQGWHRVKCIKETPIRMSVWIEACTSAQDLSTTMEILSKIKYNANKNANDNTNNNNNNNSNNNNSNNNINKKKTGNVSLPSVQPEKKKAKSFGLGYEAEGDPVDTLTVKDGESLAKVLSDASYKYGMPMTKSITYYCPFCLKAVHSLVQHAKESHMEKITYAPGANKDAKDDDGGMF